MTGMLGSRLVVRAAAALLVVALGVGAALPATARPAPAVTRPDVAADNTHFSVPPIDQTAGPDGNVWVFEGNGTIARVDPDRSIKEFPGPPQAFAAPAHLIAAGPGGYIWFRYDAAHQIVRMTLGGKWHGFVLPSGLTPSVLTSGPDGTLWFIAESMYAPVHHWFGSLAPDGTFSPLVDLGAATGPGGTIYDMTVGPDGAMWYLGFGTLSRATLDGSATSFPVPAPNQEGFSYRLTTGPDGNLWYVRRTPVGNEGAIVRVTPAGAATVFQSSFAGQYQTSPSEIVAGPDGALWFSDGRYLGRIQTDGYLEVFDYAQFGITSVYGLAFTPDGTLWFLDANQDVDHWLGVGLYVSFVQRIYVDVLGRPAEPGAVTYWVQRFFAPGGLTDTGQLTQLLLDTQEWRDHEVVALYQKYLRRDIDPGGLAYWSAQLAAGYRIEDLESLIIGSDEYYRNQGNGHDDTYITAVYQDLLHRDPDNAGLAYWTARLAAGDPRASVAFGLVYSNEALRVVVQQIYTQYLGRPTDPAGETYWADQLAHGASDQTLIALITASDEYFFKGQPAHAP